MGSWFSRAVEWIFGFFGKVFDNFIHDIGSQLEVLKPEIQAVVYQVVQDAVKAAQEAGGSPHDKLGAAVGAVVADLATKGIPLALHVVYSLVLAAVSDLHMNAAPVANP